MLQVSVWYSLLSRRTIFYDTLFPAIRRNIFRKSTNVCYSVRPYSIKCTMKVLNVAEKHDAAKNIAGYLSRGSVRKVSNIT